MWGAVTIGWKLPREQYQLYSKTARDYIHKPMVWGKLLVYTSDLEFDPHFSWSVMWLQWLKNHSSNLPLKWVDFGQDVRKISSTKVNFFIPTLVEEFDRVAQSQLESTIPSDGQLKHWSNYRQQKAWSYYENILTALAEIHEPYDDESNSCQIMDLLSASVRNLIEPYVEPKITADPSIMQRGYDPSSAVLTFLDLPEYPGRGLMLLVFLLEHNANFNVACHGHSLWEIWFLILHRFDDSDVFHGEFQYTLAFRAMEIMLQRGADLEA